MGRKRGRPKKFQAVQSRKGVRIDVTPEDIKLGKRGSSKCCPIALALNRASQNLTTRPIEVNQTYAVISHPDRDLAHTLPDEALYFIKNFDANDEVRPFSFYFEINKLLQ